MLGTYQLDFLQRFARDNGCTLVLEGTVGFGRPCIGITWGFSYVSFERYSLDYKNPEAKEILRKIRNAEPERAYHKGDFLCVLKTDDESQLQLYNWVKDLYDQGFKVRSTQEIDYGPGTTTMTELMTGRRGIIGELFLP